MVVVLVLYDNCVVHIILDGCSGRIDWVLYMIDMFLHSGLPHLFFSSASLAVALTCVRFHHDRVTFTQPRKKRLVCSASQKTIKSGCLSNITSLSNTTGIAVMPVGTFHQKWHASMLKTVEHRRNVVASHLLFVFAWTLLWWSSGK